MTDQEREEVDRDILRHVLDEMQFYTGRWVCRYGIPDDMSGSIGAKARSLKGALSSARDAMHDLMRTLQTGEEMNYLTEVSGRSQTWQQQLEAQQREVMMTLSEPGQVLKDALPGVMTALQAMQTAINAALQAAKNVELAARAASQGVK